MANGKITWTPPTFLALALDEAHYLAAADSAFNLGVGDFGLDALLYIDSAMTDAEGWICAKGAASLDSAAGWHLVVDPANRRIGLRLNDGHVAATLVYSDDAAFVFDTWFWLAVRADRDGNAYFYVDGAVVGSGSIAGAPGSLDNGESFKVGGYDAATNRLKGYIGLLRVDQGRLLPASWVAREWDRLRYGLPRTPEDFTAMWLFGESLLDAAGLYTLTYIPPDAPAYVTGYPSGPINYEFEENFDFNHSSPFLDGPTPTRTLNGALTSYDPGWRKRRLEWQFRYVPPGQVTAIMAAAAALTPVTFYADASLPPLFTGLFMSQPVFEEEAVNLWNGDIEAEEV